MSRGSSRNGRATGKAPQGKSTVTRNRTQTAATRTNRTTAKAKKSTGSTAKKSAATKKKTEQVTTPAKPAARARPATGGRSTGSSPSRCPGS